MIRPMLLSLAYSMARFLAELCLVRNLGKPPWQPGDRLVLAALGRLLPKSAWSALPPSPETLSALALRPRPPLVGRLSEDSPG